MPRPVQDADALDDLDRAVIEALQVSPRASWAAVGAALDVDPVTVARRWKRLSGDGSAWVTAYPIGPDLGGGAVALVDIGVDPARLDTTARAIGQDPHVFTLERATGAHSLTAIVAAPDLAELTGHCIDRIERAPGVRAVEIHLVTRLFLEASRWRIRGLSPAQLTRLKEAAPPPPVRTAPHAARPDADVVAALAADGRTTGAELAALLDIGVHTARRRLDRVIADGHLVFRCDVAQPLTGWPVCATFRATVAPGKVTATAQTLSTLPEIRMCLATTGPHNLHISVWLRSTADVHRLETLLAERLPELHIADRVVVLRQYKASGRTLDAAGRAVPADRSGGVGPPAAVG
ncbi:Lrp/AsnC family transcriptional regulator [Yinghuangia soli]|uniref:Lrp/AsnC family transcriptional regulator n=1 Tax=Yinghuangia soli TaxID=2908204 RepID=A0AA41U9A7_9ACTN|nr:Lrp/AsnC family transcriptional regulator [Yinghuangia soli]MCF2533684.1 Lrp/AsnC family transcriptional regulator [Yinghuangia soli]